MLIAIDLSWFNDYYEYVIESFFHQKILFLLVGLLLISFAFQLFFYFKYYSKLSKYKTKTDNSLQTPVSVIICAKDEAENLLENLPKILKQDYPEFEVIVVDDGSEDETQTVLKILQKDFPHLKISNLNKNESFFKGKKLALTIGIKAAKYDTILLTDADCKPETNQWIKLMQSKYSDKKEIILGYGGYEKKDGLLNKLIRFDAFFTALQYFGFAIKGNTFMGVGRNLSYKKQLFFKNKGFASHYHLSSGDDDLFINEVATKNNVDVMLEPESFIRSIPKESFKDWLLQKRRHLTTGKKYRSGHKFLLSIEPFSRIMFLLLIIAILAIDYMHFYIAILFFIRLIITLVIFKKAMRRLSEKDLLVSSLVFNFVIPLIISVLHFRNLFNSSQNKWK